MTRIMVGGRELHLTKDEVVRRMRNMSPEPIREHFVEIASTAFPPKQALEQVTGWNRRTYTTMEATRVFTRLGFVCRRAEHDRDDHAVRSREDFAPEERSSVDHRLSTLEAALGVVQEAIAGLRNRVSKLETAT